MSSYWYRAILFPKVPSIVAGDGISERCWSIFISLSTWCGIQQTGFCCEMQVKGENTFFYREEYGLKPLFWLEKLQGFSLLWRSWLFGPNYCSFDSLIQHRVPPIHFALVVFNSYLIHHLIKCNFLQQSGKRFCKDVAMSARHRGLRLQRYHGNTSPRLLVKSATFLADMF